MSDAEGRQSEARSVEADLLVHDAAELLTVAGVGVVPRLRRALGELGLIRGGAVASRQGRIVAVGETRAVRDAVRLREGGRAIDASGMVVMPGLVDAHTHPVFAGSREAEFVLRLGGLSYTEIALRGGGIVNTVQPTRQASFAELVALTRRRLDTMLLHGTTTAEAKSGYGLTVPDEIKILEVIRALGAEHPVDLVPTFLGAHAFPPEYRDRRDEYVDLVVKEMLPEVGARGLAEFCDVAFVPKRAFTERQSERILACARDHGMRARMHVDEFAPDGGGGLAARLGAVSADHCIFTPQNELELMARAGVGATLMPAAPFALRIGRYADARAMVETGLAVALGTDFNASCLCESMPLTISLACLKMGLTPPEALVAATINGAWSLGRAHEVGSLEVGKASDLLVLDCPTHVHIPFHFGVNRVRHVVKRGAVVVRDGRRVDADGAEALGGPDR